MVRMAEPLTDHSRGAPFSASSETSLFYTPLLVARILSAAAVAGSYSLFAQAYFGRGSCAPRNEVRRITSSKVTRMRDSQERAREDRVRRLAKQKRLILKKARRRNPDASDYGRYWLIEPSADGIIEGGQNGALLGEIEASLSRR
jgi:hypothetical protein